MHRLNDTQSACLDAFYRLSVNMIVRFKAFEPVALPFGILFTTLYGKLRWILVQEIRPKPIEVL